jgi:hypothetical protein
MGILYVVGINFDKPLTLFQTKNDEDEVKRNIYEVEAEKEYVFTFDIEANSRLENLANYSIRIAEEDKYYDTLINHEIEFGNFQGEKEIRFTTTKDTVKMAMYFNTNSIYGQKGLTINSLKINGKNFSLSYAYLPIRLVERVQSFSSKDKSVWERGVYFADGIKIIKNNALFGAGAKGWLYNYEYVQSYVYSTTEAHSFVLQTFIDNGIIGFATLIIILIFAIIKILNKRKNINEIDLAFILLTMHSFMDFDMSFYCIMVLWIVLFSIIRCHPIEKSELSNQKDTKNKKIMMVISIGIIVINICALIFSIFIYKVKNDNTKNIEEIYSCMQEEKYNEEIEQIKRYKKKEKYYEFIFELGEIDYSKVSDENIEYIYNEIKNQQIITNTDYNMERNELIKNILETLENKEYLSKFADIILSENEEITNNILNQDKNRLADSKISRYLAEQEEIYEYSKQVNK